MSIKINKILLCQCLHLCQRVNLWWLLFLLFKTSWSLEHQIIFILLSTLWLFCCGHSRFSYIPLKNVDSLFHQVINLTGFKLKILSVGQQSSPVFILSRTAFESVWHYIILWWARDFGKVEFMYKIWHSVSLAIFFLRFPLSSGFSCTRLYLLSLQARNIVFMFWLVYTTLYNSGSFFF